jgi:hypothetical protein
MTTRDLGRCLFCLSPAEELHHPTCRLRPDRPYLDPEWTIPLCIPCHRAEHAAWRDFGLDDIADPEEARVRRNLWFLGRLRDLGRPVTFSPDVLWGFHGSLLAMRWHAP